ncbi:MAG: SDR family oxidoreductase [Balneolaceae bacterium]
MNNKTVFITGATKGIGYTTAKRLLENNYTVYGTWNRTSVPDDLAKHLNFHALQADLSDPDSLSSIPSFFQKHHFPDILINNAGIFDSASCQVKESFWNEKWERTIMINLTAPVRLTRWFVLDWLEKGRDGMVINISSRAAYRGETVEYPAYAASKGGMLSFTKTIARSYGKQGITAYNIAPGFVDTDMAREAIEKKGEESVKDGLALNELATPEDVASVISFIASGQAKQMTGTTFHINGGSWLL